MLCCVELSITYCDVEKAHFPDLFNAAIMSLIQGSITRPQRSSVPSFSNKHNQHVLQDSK